MSAGQEEIFLAKPARQGFWFVFIRCSPRQLRGPQASVGRATFRFPHAWGYANLVG
jgi:hypothetical protein